MAAMTVINPGCKARNEIYRQRRDVVLQTLHRLGLEGEHATCFIVRMVCRSGRPKLGGFHQPAAKNRHMSALPPDRFLAPVAKGMSGCRLPRRLNGYRKPCWVWKSIFVNTPENQGFHSNKG